MNDWLHDAVRREGAAMFADHPPSDQLVLYAESPQELTAAQAAALDAHLRVCGTCADDLAHLEAALAELSSADERDPHRDAMPWRQRLARIFAPSRWIPAAAVAVVALVWIGVQDRAPVLDQPIARSVGQAVMLRVEAERGAPVSARPDQGGLVSLMFELPGDDDGAITTCQLALLNSTGDIVAEVPDARATDPYGTFLVTIDARMLAAGEYSVVTRDRVGERRFFFALSPSR